MNCSIDTFRLDALEGFASFGVGSAFGAIVKSSVVQTGLLVTIGYIAKRCLDALVERFLLKPKGPIRATHLDTTKALTTLAAAAAITTIGVAMGIFTPVTGTIFGALALGYGLYDLVQARNTASRKVTWRESPWDM